MSKRIFVERGCQSIIFSREKAQAVDNELDDELQVWFFNFNLSAHIWFRNCFLFFSTQISSPIIVSFVLCRVRKSKEGMEICASFCYLSLDCLHFWWRLNTFLQKSCQADIKKFCDGYREEEVLKCLSNSKFIRILSPDCQKVSVYSFLNDE